MKTLTKLLAIVALFIGTAHFAHAAPITGSLAFAGQYSGNFGPSGITFSGNPVVLYGGTMDLASFNGVSGSMTYNYPAGGPAQAPNMIFMAAYGGNMALGFVVSGATYSAANNGQFVFTGTLVEAQYSGTYNSVACSTAAPCIINQNTSAVLTITSTGAGIYSAQILAPTPEPSSLLLLGTGLVGAAGMMTLKRRLV